MKPMLFLTAALAMTGTMAFAAPTAESIAADLKAQGYTSIEIQEGAAQITAEATRGTERLEVTYDAVSGNVIKINAAGSGSDLGVAGMGSESIGSDDSDHGSSDGSDHGSDDGSDHGSSDGGDHGSSDGGSDD